MEIFCDYEGGSILLLANNRGDNIINLSLKKEFKAYSHYYNFQVKNSTSKIGYVQITNINLSKYFHKSAINYPYYKNLKETSKWQRFDKSKCTINDNKIIISILPGEYLEISLVPRYIKEDLERFLVVNKNDNLKVKEEILTKIEIGDEKLPSIFVIARQHPGETLSSFFVEGMIKAVLENKLYLNYHFVFYPLVNLEGIKNGNHRYVKNIDFNRNWNSRHAAKEIKYLKKQLDMYNLKCFIDVHNDEITPINYIRANDINNLNLDDFKILKSMNPLYRFFRGLIKQRKIINVWSLTARDYVNKKYKCFSILVELSMKCYYTKCIDLGNKFMVKLLKKEGEL